MLSIGNTLRKYLGYLEGYGGCAEGKLLLYCTLHIFPLVEFR